MKVSDGDGGAPGGGAGDARVARLEAEVQRLRTELASRGRALVEAAREGNRTSALAVSRLHLYDFAAHHTLAELLRETIDEAERLTQSQVGFYHFVDADQRGVSLQACSTRTTREFCRAIGAGTHYGLDQAGVWADCVRERRPIIHNDYASLTSKRGLPDGHAPLHRELVVPIFREGRAVAILGVGNRPSDYVEDDIEALRDLANAAWEIAERKRAEDALHANEQRLDFAIRSSRAGVWDWDVERNRMVWDDRMLELYGVDRSSFTADVHAWEGGLHPDDRSRAVEACERALAGEAPYDTEFRVVQPDGRVRYIKADGLVLRGDHGRATRMIGLNRDVTEQRLADEERRRIALDLAERCKELHCLYAIARLDEQRGLSLDDRLRATVELLPSAYRFPELAGARATVGERVHATERFRDTPLKHSAPIRANGAEVGLLEVGYAELTWPELEPPFLVEEQSLLHEVADRLGRRIELGRAQDAAEESESRLRWALEYSHIGGWELDLVDHRSSRTVQHDRIFGYEALQPEWTYERFLEHVLPEDRALVDERFRRATSTRSDWSFECRIRRVDGEVRWIWAVGGHQPEPDGQPRRMAGIVQDITERMRAEQRRAELEEQLRHAQKMEAIGTLAGGVAHDFNNILGGLLGGLSYLELELADQGLGYRSEIRELEDLVTRGAELTRQLLGFSRRGKYDARPVDLAEVVARTSALFGRTRRDVTIHLELPDGLPAVLMDHTQLEQVLLNLFVNAGHAMPDGGDLRLRASVADLADARIAPSRSSTDGFVELVVADTGVGMDEATQARIFEPFFTTKAPGQGSGLGLASVYGIVENHGGRITVVSAPGQGAEFHLLLPVARHASTLPEAPSAVRPRGQPTVLVVDDEEPVLRFLDRLLRKLGYDTLTASGGRDAIEVVREHAARISIVILDLTMPDLSGAKTFEAIRSLAPDVKVLLVSGFTADGHARELLERGCNGFIQKPFDLATLTRTLRDLEQAS